VGGAAQARVPAERLQQPATADISAGLAPDQVDEGDHSRRCTRFRGASVVPLAAAASAMISSRRCPAAAKGRLERPEALVESTRSVGGRLGARMGGHRRRSTSQDRGQHGDGSAPTAASGVGRNAPPTVVPP